MRVALEEAERAPDRSIEAKRRHLKGGRGGGRGGGGGNDRDTERTKGGSWSKEAKEGEGEGEGTFPRVTGHPRHAQIFWQIYAQ